jgi:type IV secretory pathway TrbL component
MTWPWILAVCVAAVAFVAGLWWYIFRGAMKYPNNGNEFSVDTEGYPPG